MKLPSGTYICIEGAIGVGKTSLAELISNELGDARLILEEVETNPFLPDFYRDPHRYALQAQLCFLMMRHRQQSELKQLSLFNRTVVADYLYEKDRIFAYLNLEDRDLELYRMVEDVLAADVPVPDLIIYLQASAERLMTNIRIRDIDYERAVTTEYLKRLCEAYSKFFFHWDRSPLLIVNSTRIDFVNDQDHWDMLLKVIRKMPAGTTYFNPET